MMQLLSSKLPLEKQGFQIPPTKIVREFLLLLIKEYKEVRLIIASNFAGLK